MSISAPVLTLTPMTNIFEMPKYGITIRKNSQGFFIPELKLLFDALATVDFDLEFILITHVHAHQCFSLPSLLSQTTVKATVVVPTENKKSIINFVQALYPNGVPLEHEFIGVRHNDTVKIKNNMYLKVYELDHVLPCYGYGLVIARSQLKKEYTGINRHEVIRLKRNGTQLTEVIHEPMLIYLSDTSVSIFEQYPEIYSYPYLIVSYTYDDQAEEKKKINWLSLYPIILSHPDNIFVLFGERKLPPQSEISNLTNVVFTP